MPRRARHNRSMRSDPTREPELFPADEIPATNTSSPLSSPFLPEGSPIPRGEQTPDRSATPDGPVSSAGDPGAADAEVCALPTDPKPGNEPSPTDPMLAADLESLFDRLSRSAFRSRFRLRTAERSYIEQKGLATLRRHAEEFVRTRLAPALPPNDGRQTPMRGHPVFIAQHATGCCCRGCLAKWHGIPAGRPLTEAEQRYVVRVLLAWISRQLGH